MKNSKNISRLGKQTACGLVTCGSILLFLTSLVAQNANRQQPKSQNNAAPSSGRQHSAIIRATTSSEGSRVSLTTDQSLNDYEAYRTGDRFYVRIPPTDVPRAQTARGRGFEDLKVQRNADSTVLSFRLQPGATARVEQRSNQLDVVFKAAGATASTSGANGPRTASQQTAGTRSPINQRSSVSSNTDANSRKGVPVASPASGGSSSAATSNLLPSKAIPSPTYQPNEQSTSSSGSASSSNQSTPVAPASSPNVTLKQRMEYLLLLAKLNPVPLSIGLAVLVLLLALFFFQRRGTKGPRGVRRKQSSNTRPSVMVTPGASKTSAPVATAAPVVAPIPHSAGQAVRDHEQQARITRVAEQIKYVLSGEDYDRAVIASDDPATRQLVGAELVSALAGRDGTRRDRAREAFMSNGYFDDATRDLRVAESPAERAAGARRLSFVHDPAATPHLAAALEDSSPDVRRASVEALLDQRDPSATSALNALMKVEASNKVPRALIQQAIDACATSQTEVQPASNSAFASTHSSVAPKEFHPQPEREVIEI